MTRLVFEEELANLETRLVNMGHAVSYRIEKLIEIFKEGDPLLMQEVAAGDDEIDRMEIDNERLCLKLITTQQPVSSDLRFIMATLKILTDIEREGDQCEDICEILIAEKFQPSDSEVEKMIIDSLVHIYKMFANAMDAFVSSNVSLAREVILADQYIDDSFDASIRMIANDISSRQEEEVEPICHDSQVSSKGLEGDGSDGVRRQVNMLFIMKYIERMGDHATNIAEWALYRATGKHPKLDS